MHENQSLFPSYSPPTAELTHFRSADIMATSTEDDTADDPGNW